MPPRRFKKKSVRKIVEKRVAKAIEKYEKTRADSNNTGGSGSTNTGGTVVPEMHGCSYKTFMNGKPHSFKGTEGVVGLKRWFEKMEQVFEICKCAEDDKTLWDGKASDPLSNEMDIEAYKTIVSDECLMCHDLCATEKKKIKRYIVGFGKIKGNSFFKACKLSMMHHHGVNWSCKAVSSPKLSKISTWRRIVELGFWVQVMTSGRCGTVSGMVRRTFHGQVSESREQANMMDSRESATLGRRPEKDLVHLLFQADEKKLDGHYVLSRLPESFSKMFFRFLRSVADASGAIDSICVKTVKKPLRKIITPMMELGMRWFALTSRELSLWAKSVITTDKCLQYIFDRKFKYAPKAVDRATYAGRSSGFKAQLMAKRLERDTLRQREMVNIYFFDSLSGFYQLVVTCIGGCGMKESIVLSSLADVLLLTKSAHFLPIREDYKTEKLAKIYTNEIVASLGCAGIDLLRSWDGTRYEKAKRRKIISSKVRWNSQQGAEYTWKREDQFRKKYPNLFSEPVLSSARTGALRTRLF
ncbi:hypothetical protein Tco_0083861 [Tanacetum coccineum]